MDRLTKRGHKKQALLIGTSCSYGYISYDCKLKEGNELLKSALNKLAEYEDLEEQGRLLKLPCKIGDTVYVIEDDCEGDPACCYHTCDVCNQRNLHIEEAKFNVEDIEVLEEYIFLTKSEAEAKLNELKKHQ